MKTIAGDWDSFQFSMYCLTNAIKQEQPGDLTGTDHCIFYAKLEIGSTESQVQFLIAPVKPSNLTEAEKKME